MANLRNEKAADLAESEGFEDIIELLEEYIHDSVNPGICMNPGCYYTTTVEPDCTDGYCENCNTNSVLAATMFII